LKFVVQKRKANRESLSLLSIRVMSELHFSYVLVTHSLGAINKYLHGQLNDNFS
jgi:hypothetical protein